MGIEEVLLLVLLAFIPAGLLFLATKMMMQKFFEREYAERAKEVKELSRKKTLPLRLQAIERLVLYLERINPTNSIMTHYKPNMSGSDLQSTLLAQIRSEYDHNIAQQVYVGEDSWEALKTAKEETIKIINIAAQEAGKEANALQFSNTVYELMAQLKEAPSDGACRIIKREARRLF